MEVILEGATFPDPSPGWLYAALWGALGLVTIVVIVWVATRRRCSTARRAVCAGAVLVGTVVAVLLWAPPVQVTVGPDGGGVTCPYDAVGMAASSGRLTDVDRRCRSTSTVRVGWGAAAAVGAAGFALVLTRGPSRRPVGA